LETAINDNIKCLLEQLDAQFAWFGLRGWGCYI
jgi:hypothetical protein